MPLETNPSFRKNGSAVHSIAQITAEIVYAVRRAAV